MYYTGSNDSDFISLESVLAGKHPKLATFTANRFFHLWIVKAGGGRVGICTVRSDAEGKPLRLSLNFKCPAARLHDLVETIQAAAQALEDGR